MAVACAGLMLGGAALAQNATRTPPAAQPQTPAAEQPSTPAASTPTATPARTARTLNAQHYTQAERTARREMCTQAATERGLSGKARRDFMQSCHLEVVTR
jgi:hypothetical protein